jgi:hypothetical protein
LVILITDACLRICYTRPRKVGDGAVKARQLIASASYGPEALKVLGQAFDNAWAEIAHHFQDPPEIEAARLRLANVILDLARQGTRDPEGLKNLALQMLSLTYRRLRGPGETPPDGA